MVSNKALPWSAAGVSRIARALLLASLFVVPVACGDEDDDGTNPPPMGACCAADGSCSIDERESCEDAGGTYLGNDTDCDNDPCPDPTGACCLADGQCVVNAQPECADAGGFYSGDGTSCDANPCFGTVMVRLSHAFGPDSLRFNDVRYVSEAGNRMTVATLLYYISDVELSGPEGVHATEIVHYVDGEDENTLTLMIHDVPVRHYDLLSFTYGLDESDNQTGALPNDFPHINMIWPGPWGGGYHYMKLEGSILDSEGIVFNYATHIGRFFDQKTQESFHHYFEVPLEIHSNVVPGMTLEVEVIFDVKEWYEDPHTIDVMEHTTGIMTNTPMQNLLEANGASVFRVGEISSGGHHEDGRAVGVAF